jgi:DNA-binding XRE family transcriptional regulator
MSERGLRDWRGILAAELRDPEFREMWESLAPTRVMAIRLIEYRVDNKLTQTALERLLGMSQPAVARLEAGEHLPTLATLRHISEALGIEILANVDLPRSV